MLNSSRSLLSLLDMSCTQVSLSDSDCSKAVNVLLLFLALDLGFVCFLFTLQVSSPTFFHLGLPERCSFLILFMTILSNVSLLSSALKGIE
jgi:hypothetical protein